MPGFLPRPQQPPLDTPENSGPAYVVYLGQSKSSGFYRRYRNSNEELGVESIAPTSFHSRLVKSFPTVQAAESTYQECLQTGVLALLALDETPNTVYIVTKGYQPGVYTSKYVSLRLPFSSSELTSCRMNVLAYGLEWRGGEVTCTESTVPNAKAIFELWNALGHITRLRWDRKFVLDDFARSA